MLGRIRSPEAIPLLCCVAQAGRGQARLEAIRSLGFFGRAPAEETFGAFGGKIWSVALPPAPSRRATRALLEVLDRLRSARATARRIRVRREQSAWISSVRSTAFRALRSHRSPEVARAALEALRRGEGAHVFLGSSDAGDLLVRNLEHLKVESLLALLRGDRASVRRAAVAVLGWTADARAVAPLLDLLADTALRKEADDALSRLAGIRPDPRVRKTTKSAEEWVERLGRNGERLDPAKCIRHEDPKPGVYRYGA